METQPEPIADLATKLMAGTATEAEKDQLAEWIAAKPGRDTLICQWMDTDHLKQEYENAYPTMDTLERLRHKLHDKCNHSIY